MRMLKALKGSGIFFFTLLLAAHAAQAATSNDVVATINGKDLTKVEFDRRYKENIQIFKFTPPTKANVLNDIINFELAVQEAKKQGLDKDPQIQERLNAVLYQSLVEKQLTEKFRSAVDVTEKEARDFCKRNPAVRASHVFVALKPAALKSEEDAANKKIREAQAALSAGMKFEQAVTKFSEGYATEAGGDIGYQTKDKLDPTFYMETRKLSMNEVSKPVRSQFGMHLIKLTGVQDCAKISIPEWQRMVFDEKRAKIFEDFMRTLRAKAKVSVNDALIKE